MLGYNPRRESSREGSGRPGGFLFTWDGGNQLTYPVKYHDIGYRDPGPPTTDPPETGAYTARSPQVRSSTSRNSWLEITLVFAGPSDRDTAGQLTAQPFPVTVAIPVK